MSVYSVLISYGDEEWFVPAIFWDDHIIFLGNVFDSGGNRATPRILLGKYRVSCRMDIGEF